MLKKVLLLSLISLMICESKFLDIQDDNTSNISGKGTVKPITLFSGSCQQPLTGCYVSMNGEQFSPSLCGTCIAVHGAKQTLKGIIADKNPYMPVNNILIKRECFNQMFPGQEEATNIQWESISC